MKSIRRKSTHGFGFVLALSACLAMAGCMTGYGGGARGGYGQNQPRDAYATVIGTVQRIDRGDNRIVLEVRDRRGYRNRGTLATVAYTQRTRLHYQSRPYSVENLERGDVIRVDAQRSRQRLVAYSIEVLRNVRDPYGGGQGGQRTVVHGTVLDVDPYAHVIALNVRYGGRSRISYNNRTIVEYAGRRYQPRNLQRGDVIRIRLRRYGNQWFAAHIQVMRDATPGGRGRR